MTRLALASVFVLLAAGSVAAEPPPSGTPAPIPAVTRLERLQALAGVWDADMDGDGKADTDVTYRVTAGGSAVLETLFGGTPKEMLTLYTVDGDDLVLTHYCMLKNQPHMKAASTPDAAKLSFSFVSGGNMKSRDDMHMDSLTVTFTDATHFKQDWVLWQDGKAVKTVSLAWAKKSE
jgi:hypothetical protein